MEHVGQGGTGETPLMVNELTGKHSDQHDANKVRSACRQRVNQALIALAARYTGAAARGWDGWDALDIHPPCQISDRFCYSFGKTRKQERGKLWRSVNCCVNIDEQSRL
jgi:hypothetical protein